MEDEKEIVVVKKMVMVEEKVHVCRYEEGGRYEAWREGMEGGSTTKTSKWIS